MRSLCLLFTPWDLAALGAGPVLLTMPLALDHFGTSGETTEANVMDDGFDKQETR